MVRKIDRVLRRDIGRSGREDIVHVLGKVSFQSRHSPLSFWTVIVKEGGKRVAWRNYKRSVVEAVVPVT